MCDADARHSHWTVMDAISQTKSNYSHQHRHKIDPIRPWAEKMGEGVLILCEELIVRAAARVFGSAAYCYMLSVIEIKEF